MDEAVIVRAVDQQQPTATPRSVAREPIYAAAEELEHPREVGEEGQSPATSAIVAGVVLAFVATFVAAVVVVVFLVARFS